MKFILKTATVLASAALLLSSCDDMNSIHEDYYSDSLKPYLSIPEIIDIQAGYERARVFWSVDADVRLENTVIYWTYDEKLDSVVVPITNRNEMWAEIELPEANYIIEMKNIGAEGTSSLTTEMPVTVFGDRYISLMKDRPVASSSYDPTTGETTINWGNADGLVSQMLTYTNEKGQSTDLFIDGAETSTVLKDAAVGTPFSYTTTYKFAEALDPLTTLPSKGMVLPIHSLLIPKSEYNMVAGLQGEAEVVSASYSIEGLWDGNITNLGFASASYSDRKAITIDLGAEYRLGSIKIWQPQGDKIIYRGSSIKTIALYGCLEDPSTEAQKDKLGLYTTEDYVYDDGNEIAGVVFPDFTYWTSILSSASVDQPSDLGAGSSNADDAAAALAGHEFAISANTPAVRYIRIQLIDQWDNAGGLFAMTELEVYGAKVE